MLLIIAICTIASTFANSVTLPSEFWAQVGSDGALIDATEASLVAPRYNGNFGLGAYGFDYASFVASRSDSTGGEFAQFGAALKDANGTYCAWFPTSLTANEKICGNFSILSMPDEYKNVTQFQWKPVYFGGAGIDVDGSVQIGNHLVGAQQKYYSIGIAGFFAGYQAYMQYGDFSATSQEAVAVWTTANYADQYGVQHNFGTNIVTKNTTKCGDGALYTPSAPIACLFLLHVDLPAIL